MSACGNPNPIPFTIFQGDSKIMPMKLVYAQSGNPYDLTSCSEIVVNLRNADGTIEQLKLSLSKVTITDPPVLGQFTVLIESDVSQLLNVGELQNVDVTFTVSGLPFTVQFQAALSVFQVD